MPDPNELRNKIADEAVMKILESCIGSLGGLHSGRTERVIAAALDEYAKCRCTQGLLECLRLGDALEMAREALKEIVAPYDPQYPIGQFERVARLKKIAREALAAMQTEDDGKAKNND